MEELWRGFCLGIDFLLANLIFYHILFSIVIIFFQRREAKSVWTWLMVLHFIPILGFLLYLVLGADIHKRKMFKGKEIEDRLNELVRRQELMVTSETMEIMTPEITGYADMVMYNLSTMGAILFEKNKVDIIIDGNEKFNLLMEDIRHAKRFVHIQYYIIKQDIVFEKIVEILKYKVMEGVDVRILYDGMGSRGVRKRYWKSLHQSGMKVVEFFPPLLGRIHLRMNYRNHRKLVIIDNEIGYVGGFNIGKEYLGLDEKFGYWRDTHLRITGEGVQGLQVRFLLDWNYASKESLTSEKMYLNINQSLIKERCELQIIYSGPDCYSPNIRDNYIRLIHKAKQSICIQSPYFIPDESMMSALYIAIQSGIEVMIMIPCKPDHMFVYWATYSYLGDLIYMGAKCYQYNKGFLHAKGMIIDDKIFCYGTANMDVRSFSLNFEVNAIIYNQEKAREMRMKFEEDLINCTQITKDKYEKRSYIIRVKEQVSRLLSPIL